MDILCTIGYSRFSNADDILNSYKKIPNTPQLLRDLTLNKKDLIERDLTHNVKTEVNGMASCIFGFRAPIFVTRRF
jgi:hypothetical protein